MNFSIVHGIKPIFKLLYKTESLKMHHFNLRAMFNTSLVSLGEFEYIKLSMKWCIHKLNQRTKERRLYL
ncbi:hypothetical protein C1I91_24390 [Clostridium manihotivorum]|uniref:Uncharacterized protein n=1 Tax=Clostridium manihotivorum TaxID=2320868 RepID=A0A3R5UBA7_9CLOT|nr:hypothetical protein C1I91_24390 [Clostridium manihotivorum]